MFEKERSYGCWSMSDIRRMRAGDRTEWLASIKSGSRKRQNRNIGGQGENYRALPV